MVQKRAIYNRTKKDIKETTPEHKIKHEYDRKIEQVLINRVIDNEYRQAESNNVAQSNDYSSYLTMLNCERDAKKYKWLSDVSTCEFTSLHLTSQSQQASQNFSTRDFVNVYIGNPEHVDNAKAIKACIDSTLNRYDLFYFQKIMRAVSMKDLGGVVYARCWWEQKTRIDKIGTMQKIVQSDRDIFGNEIINPELQTPDIDFMEADINGEIIERDRFNFDILDPRDVFASSEYTYTIQEKEWVIIRYNTTLDWMSQHQDDFEFINLEVLKNIHLERDEKGKGTHSDYYGIPKAQDSSKKPVKNWLIVERYGKDWVEENEDGTIKPGYDEHGNITKNAKLRYVIMGFAVNSSHRVLVRHHLNKLKDARGFPYLPLIRGLCYVHPSKDDGIGDGKGARELQTALDDTINISNDRVTLATIVQWIGKKYSVEENDTIYTEPGHVMKLEDVNDLVPVQISSDISGALNQAGYFEQKMQQLQAIDPGAMGRLPIHSGETATAVARAEGRTNTRNQYKELSFANTFLSELYRMIVQMTYQFAKVETAFELMGEKARYFDPTLEYSYRPITEAIETEHGKRAKTEIWLRLAQILASGTNRNVPAILNQIYTNIVKLQGAEFESITALLDESQPFIEQQQGSIAAGGGAGGGLPASNQSGLAQSTIEQGARQTT
jgi:hypothetical protein